MSTASQRRPATVEDWLSHREDEHLELIRGSLIGKASPSREHAQAQLATGMALAGPFRYRRSGGPGGWLFYTELDVRLGNEVLRPDVCGYRRERIQSHGRERPFSVVPDWVCEILSASNQSNDRIEKQQTHFRAGIPHYWLIDPEEESLEVLRRTDLAYAIVLTARRGQRVRAEPFDAVELAVDELLGLDTDAGG
jgi:Uma2 family endonuclease